MADYYYGHTQLELDRLMAQDVMMRPITERLLLRAGLRPGMRVLDLGCGAGDVALLIAEHVGPNGLVVGMDLAEKAVTLSRHRAAEAGHRNAVFHVASDPKFTAAAPFDFVMSRFTLAHQEDPVEFIRGAASYLRPGGILAFHEMDMQGKIECQPPLPLLEENANNMLRTLCKAFPSPEVARRMVALYVEAGLPAPQIFCERPTSNGEDTSFFRVYATAVASAQAVQKPEEPPLSVDALVAQLAGAVQQIHGQVVAMEQYCVWAQV